MTGRKIKSSEITSETDYENRRTFLRRAGILAGSTLATGIGYRYLNPPSQIESDTADIEGIRKTEGLLDDELTPFADISNYNNFYEFSTSKTSVAGSAQEFETNPWTVSIDGLVEKPTVFGIEDLLKIEQEERIYRFRCVEGWSMVIPWVGFPLAKLLKKVLPLANAKYVAFQTFYPGKNPDGEGVRLPAKGKGMQSSLFAGIDFPYVEGLRLDEAMNPLAILATGIYGKIIPNQNGAPIRLVVPWKYGFKSIKSIVRIRLTDAQPPTSWNLNAPKEYGFLSNVNPNVDHPRWSQATERRIGEFRQRKSLLFNGYGDEVAHLYEGIDLSKQF